jgi:hypothetical protein
MVRMMKLFLTLLFAVFFLLPAYFFLQKESAEAITQYGTVNPSPVNPGNALQADTVANTGSGTYTGVAISGDVTGSGTGNIVLTFSGSTGTGGAVRQNGATLNEAVVFTGVPQFQQTGSGSINGTATYSTNLSGSNTGTVAWQGAPSTTVYTAQCSTCVIGTTSTGSVSALSKIAAANLPIATTSNLGGVVPDGTTIGVTATGAISVISAAYVGLTLSGAVSGSTTGSAMTTSFPNGITGTGAMVSASGATLISPALGTIASGNISNGTGSPALAVTNMTGTGGFNTTGNAGTVSSVTGATGNIGGNSGGISGASVLPNGTTATTQPTGDNSNQLETTAGAYALFNVLAAGLSPKPTAYAAAISDLGSWWVYNNGSSGSGATLTGTGASSALFDGMTLTATGTNVFIKAQTSGTGAAENGVYTVTTTGSASVNWVLTRNVDMNTAANFPGAVIFVETGSTLFSTIWINTNVYSSLVIGTTPITFTQTGLYSAASPITLNGQQFGFSASAPLSNNTSGTASGAASLTANATITGGGINGFANAYVIPANVGGTSDAITLTPSPAITGYVEGQEFLFDAKFTNTTGTGTVAISGLSAVPMYMGSVLLPIGGLLIGQLYRCRVESTSGGPPYSARLAPYDTVSSNGDTMNGSLQITMNGTTQLTTTNNGAQSTTGGSGYIGYADPGAAVTSGNRFGFQLFGGSVDSAHTLANPVGMAGFATQNQTSSNQGGKIVLYTTPNNSTAASGRRAVATFDQDGSATFLGPVSASSFSGSAATTQSTGDNSTKLATTAYLDGQVQTTKIDGDQRIESLDTSHFREGASSTSSTTGANYLYSLLNDYAMHYWSHGFTISSTGLFGTVEETGSISIVAFTEGQLWNTYSSTGSLNAGAQVNTGSLVLVDSLNMNTGVRTFGATAVGNISGNAGTATGAMNMRDGSYGQMTYQTAPGATAFTSTGANAFVTTTSTGGVVISTVLPPMAGCILSGSGSITSTGSISTCNNMSGGIIYWTSTGTGSNASQFILPANASGSTVYSFPSGTTTTTFTIMNTSATGSVKVAMTGGGAPDTFTTAQGASSVWCPALTACWVIKTSSTGWIGTGNWATN